MNDIVAGLLQSPEGNAAIAKACEIAARESARLHLVAVLTMATPQESDATAQFARDVEAREAELSEVAAQLRGEHGIEVVEHFEQGDLRPSRAILDVAAEVSADLIIIGLRRRSRVGKLVLGSNAQDILMEADARVLAVKAPSDEAEVSSAPA